MERKWRESNGPEGRKDASSSLSQSMAAQRTYMLPAEAPPAQRCLVVLYLTNVT